MRKWLCYAHCCILLMATMGFMWRGTVSLHATVLPQNASNRTVTWVSQDPAVASVSDQGMVTALKAGETTVTATTVNGLTANCRISVSEAEAEDKNVIASVSAPAQAAV